MIGLTKTHKVTGGLESVSKHQLFSLFQCKSYSNEMEGLSKAKNVSYNAAKLLNSFTRSFKQNVAY